MSEAIKIVVLCGGRFAFSAIQALGIEKYLAGVAIGSEEKGTVSLLDSEMGKNNIPFLSIANKKEVLNLFDWIKEIQPDAVYSICFPFLITEDILNLVPQRFINFHPGPLPEYRGPSPIFEVLRSLEKETALSVHLMDDNFDQGSVILREIVAIEEGETFGSLATKLSQRAAMSAINIAQMLAFGSSLPSTPQTSVGMAYYPAIEAGDSVINWEKMHAKEIESLINACNPWNIGADTQFKNQAVKIVAVDVIDKAHGNIAGTLFESEEKSELLIACVEDQCLKLKIISTDEGIMSGDDFNLKFKPLQQRFIS